MVVLRLLASLPSVVVVLEPSLSAVLVRKLLEMDFLHQVLEERVLEIVGPAQLIPAVQLALRRLLRYHLDYPESHYLLKRQASPKRPWRPRSKQDSGMIFECGPHTVVTRRIALEPNGHMPNDSIN